MTTTALSRPQASRRADDRAVGLWLVVCAFMIFAMAVIGAITRLTESGLSIMEWAPLTGALPPLSQAEWERVFAIYRTIPEYREVNAGMSLDEFKTIFWWEYVHRLWGRLIGVVFLVPLVWFWLRGRLRQGLGPRLAGIFALGALQGGLGWFMVASGFADRVDVSQYRLAAHLGLAFAIYALVLWVAFGLLKPLPAPAAAQGLPTMRRALGAYLALVMVTVLAGALVAGINAGLVYNTFPLMDGRLVPRGYAIMQPWPVNWFENPTAVQFNHRLLAILCVAAALGLWLWSRRLALSGVARRGFDLLLAGAAVQLGLGIATLVMVVPVWLGALHQAGALGLLSLGLWALHTLRPALGGTPAPT